MNGVLNVIPTRAKKKKTHLPPPNLFFVYFSPSFYSLQLPFCPRLPNSPGTCTLTGVAELWIVSTLELAVLELAFGLCRGAIEVSVGPTVSVILKRQVFPWKRLDKEKTVSSSN